MTPDDLRPIILVLVIASGLMLVIGVAIWYELKKIHRDLKR